MKSECGPPVNERKKPKHQGCPRVNLSPHKYDVKVRCNLRKQFINKRLFLIFPTYIVMSRIFFRP